MREKWNVILYLIWFSYLIISATVMFGNGFLLSRKTLSDVSDCLPLSEISCDGTIIGNSSVNSECSEDEKIRNVLSNKERPMACVPQQNRVLLVLVDALRYDFTEFNPTLEAPFHHQNKLPVISQTLERHPQKSRLYRFMADPPTTTFQRVKALVTGSLPTFIDASSNFAAMELQEDSFIHQIEKSSGSMVLLGDDTWARILPKKFKRSHAMYSFHTWDLDTVDTEVDSKIYNELLKDDWTLLLAHYLGVDHAGHRYGPHHPEMARKLNETNHRLERIINILPPDVLLYVIGDHGMTETGDHGGESKAERTAAFFAYRGSGLAGTNEIGKEVQQTDLAATISAAMGRPPPAPSLGNLLTTVLPKLTKERTLLLLYNNLVQVARYLVRYGEESHQIPLDKLAQLLNMTREQIDRAATINTEEELQQYIADVRSTIDNVRLVFREVWVEFDSLSMLRALLLLLLAIFFNWLMTEGLPMDRIPGIFASSFVPTGYICMGLCVAVCYTLFYFDVIDDIEHAIYLSTGLISGAVQCTLVIMHWDGISQRWYEGRSQFYERFARAALIASAVVLVSNSFIIEEGASLSFLALSVLGAMAWNICNVKALALWLCCGVVMALSRVYRGCREEQGDCWTAGLAGPQKDTRASLVIALGAVAAVASISRRHVGWGGYGVALASVLVCAHWAVGWGSLGSPARSRMLARGAWLVICSLFLIIWKRNSQGAVSPLTVCGLLMFLANCLVLGVSYAPAAALALLSGFLTINLVSMLRNSNGSNKFALSKRCNSSVACLWALLASYHFYGSGHHATLGHVRWAPAFHAGDLTYLEIGRVVTAMLVSMDLFGMHLMYGAAVPLLALWGKNSATTLGPRSQLVAIFSLSLKFALCFAVRVFAICISATVHCRHLMIWGVFTPKLLFEGASCAAALLGMLLGAILTVWHIPTSQRSS